ncbi:MAG: hypothetical protein WDN00_00555 [Limisphaerales bacterium]
MATAFISKSQHDFNVWPGQLREAIHDGDWIPTGAYELAQWEAAFHNSYKASRRPIIGDPPKNEERFFSKLNAMGIDPQEEVGIYKQRADRQSIERHESNQRQPRCTRIDTQARGIRLNQMVGVQGVSNLRG